MGYRSEVTYGVKFYCQDEPEKAYAQFIKFYNWVKKHHTVRTKEGFADYAGQKVLTGAWHLYWNVDEQMLCFEASDVKWYDSYADVQWHQQLLKEVQLYSCATFRYVRLGEDPSDIEIDEYGGKDCGAYVEIDVETKFAHNFPEEIDYNKEVRNGTV